VRELLASLAVPAGRRLILLNANAGDLLPQRKWAGSNYVLLARRLLAEFSDLAIVFTGSPEEAPSTVLLVHEIGSPHCVSAAGRTTLRELLVLYTLSEVLAHANRCGGALRTGDAAALCGARSAQSSAMGRPGVQPVRQCL
jgi:hypothetical protein